MNQDDALEMFVRFNSAGKPLRKSEITMSILEAYWPKAKEKFGEVLKGSYAGFCSDFIIRTALMLYGDVVKSNINKQTATDLQDNWSSLQKALNNLESVLKEMRIDVSRFSSSWNALLPIIYLLYHRPINYTKYKEGIRAYLVRAVLFTYFQSGTTSKLQQMRNKINDFDQEISIEMLDQIKDLMVTDGKIEDILNSEKGSRVAGEALYYLGIDWVNKNFKYEQDHLHPYERFDQTKPVSVGMNDWMAWRNLRNRLPNLQLLEGRSNGSKSNMSLHDYYNDMNEQQKLDFYKEALIPEDVDLGIENFGVFYAKRKELLHQKIKELLS